MGTQMSQQMSPQQQITGQMTGQQMSPRGSPTVIPAHKWPRIEKLPVTKPNLTQRLKELSQHKPPPKQLVARGSPRASAAGPAAAPSSTALPPLGAYGTHVTPEARTHL